MRPLIWVKNTLRNRLRAGLLGRLLLQTQGNTSIRTVRIVCATRLSEKEFWRNSALGRSLKIWRSSPDIFIDIHFENTTGLPLIYNSALRNPVSTDAVIFIHDDIWLDDSEWLAKTRIALNNFDIVGVAGNTRIFPNQVAWVFRTLEGGQGTWDTGYLSGAVGHGQRAGGMVTVFGPTPAACKLLDGLFLAVRSSAVTKSDVFFDERFQFHFYDMDFCRNAKDAGLSLGTWPIALTHQSRGAYTSIAWKEGMALYLKKWKS